MKKEIKLITAKDVSCWIRPITEKENDELKVDMHNYKLNKFAEFQLKYGFKYENLEAFGSVNVSSTFLINYIPHCVYHPLGDKTKKEISCKCYAVKDNDYKINRLHHDLISSWNCILELLNKPKFVLIYNKYEKRDTIY